MKKDQIKILRNRGRNNVSGRVMMERKSITMASLKVRLLLSEMF